MDNVSAMATTFTTTTAAAVFFFCTAAVAVAPPLASVTRADLTRDESAPLPTAWQLQPRSTVNELRRRQSSDEGSEIILLREDNTCGYIGGSDNEPFTCSEGAGGEGRCGLRTASASDAFGDILCCYSSGCYSYLYCMGYDEFAALSCEGECSVGDPGILTCTESASGNCGQVILDGTVAGLSCDAGSIFWTQYAETYVADDEGEIVTELGFSSKRLRDITIDVPNSTVISMPDIPTAQPSTSTAPPSSTDAAEATIGPPPGVIAGSVVGGSVAIALAVMAIFFARRKKRVNAAIASGTISPETFRSRRSPAPGVPRHTPGPAKRISAKGAANGITIGPANGTRPTQASAKRHSARGSANGRASKAQTKRTSAPSMSRPVKSIRYPSNMAELPADELSSEQMTNGDLLPLRDENGETSQGGIGLVGFTVQTIRRSRTF